MIGFAVVFFAATLPNAAVLEPVANMYSKPTQDADVVSQAIYGANVAIIDQRDGWAHVRTADEYTGWIPLPQLLTRAPYAVTGRVAQVQSIFAHIYRDASVTAHAPMLTAPFETKFEVAAAVEQQPGKQEPGKQEPDDARWLKIRLVDGRAGFVQTGDVGFDVKPAGISEMIAVAKRFLGFPYTWGGTSSYGYDCSGFIQMLERRRGVSLPRDAQPQADWAGAVPVERDNLEPGDLLYFGSSAKHITHTGLYLGESKFISATAHETPMVRIDDLTDPHWSGLLVALRRIK